MISVRFSAYALVLALAGPLAAQPASGQPDASEAQETQDGQSMPGITRILIRSEKLEPGSKLWVKNRNGDVRVVGWEKEEVHVIAEIRDTERRRADLVMQAKGADLDIETVFQQPFWSFDWELVQSPRCQLTLFVPHRLLGDFRTTNGSLFISYLDGYAHCETNNGDVEVKHFGGEAQIETKNGAIEANDLQARIKAVTTNGRINLTGVEGGVVAETTNGSIVAKGLDGWGEGITLRTANGSIDISLGDASGDITAEANEGGFDIKLQDAKVTEVSKRTIHLKVPGRAQAIRLHTSNGNITIRE